MAPSKLHSSLKPIQAYTSILNERENCQTMTSACYTVTLLLLFYY